ncbi:ATP-binding cassette sub-family G member 4 [Halotydeus destructor]|nr:ATP-binding cassette sub-family G member 4 [Halotydeus destructor]
MAIVLTIHQPSYRVLEMFSVIYGLSNQGKCIFSGSPDDIVDIMTKNGAECPENYNPAEFLIDVASGEYGVNTLISLAAHQEAEFTAEADGQLVGQLGSLEDLIKPGKMANYAHFKQVVIRSLRVTIRDPWLFWLRFIAHTAFPLAVALQMQPDVGQRTGCPPDFDANFDPSELEEIQIYSKRETDSVFDNNGALAVGIIVTQFCSVMPTVLTFPLEMNVFRKEKINQWYGTGSYYLGKTVADIPFSCCFPVLFGAILFYFSNQTGEWWRVTGAVSVLVVIAFAGQAHGLLVGALSMRNKSVGVYFAPFTMIPQILFCGFFLKLEDLNPIFYPMTYLSYAKNGLESMIGFVYGFQRCGADAEENMAEARQGMVIWFSDMLGVTDGRTGVTLSFVDNLVKLVAGDFVGDDGKVRSILMNHYALDDSYILPSVVYMVLMTVSIRLITYFIVVRQANSKN